MRAQWDHRSAGRHGRIKEEHHAIRRARLARQVEMQHAQGALMLASDRDIIPEPILTEAK